MRKRGETAYLISAGVIGLVAFFVIFVPWVSPYSPETLDVSELLRFPSWHHWMGTDALGRDLATRIGYGARVTLEIGLLSSAFSLLLGTVTGAIAGYHGGRVDQFARSVMDFFSLFPALLLALLLTTVMGRGLLGIFLAIGLSSWVTHARMIRAQTLQLRELTFVEAARSLGSTQGRILLRHIFPHLRAQALGALTYQLPGNMLAESFLSFLGLGVQPPRSSLGTLASDGFRALQSYPYLTLCPSLALFLISFGFTTLTRGQDRRNNMTAGGCCHL